jgi:polysaccharide export outer membrane protein
MGGEAINSTIARLLVCVAVAILIGCGGGNRMFTRRGGEVISGELVLDSIPLQREPDTYVIGYGDQLDVVFLYDNEYSRSDIKVRPDGRISFPYVGEIAVAGMTAEEVDSLLTEKFSEIIVEPDITVIVSKFQERLVYVLGEVRSPGGYTLEEGPTLLRALTMAHGPTSEAKRNGVLVIRRVAPDYIVGVQVDLVQLLDRHRFELDMPLQVNDVVFVPKSAIDRAEDFVGALFTILGRPMDVYMRGWQVVNAKMYYDYWKQQAIFEGQ